MIVELLDISEIGAGSFAVRQQEVSARGNLIFTVIQGFEARLLRKPICDWPVMVANRDQLHMWVMIAA